MLTKVKENTPKTQNFMKYVLGEILKHSPLQKGECFEIDVMGKSDLLPDFLELDVNPTEEDMKIFSEMMGKNDNSFLYCNPDRAIPIPIFDLHLRAKRKFNILWHYFQKELAGMCELRASDDDKKDSLSGIYYFTITNPEKIYREAKKYGIEVSNASNANLMPQRIHKHNPKIVLYLDKTGNLWQEPKDKYFYPMMESKERLNIIKFLAGKQTENYIRTRNLASELGKNAQYIRSEIGKINALTKDRLGLKRLKLIDSKQGSGYRINPAINIKILTRYS